MDGTYGRPAAADPTLAVTSAATTSAAATSTATTSTATRKAALRRRMLNARRTRAASSAGVGGDAAAEIARRALTLPELANARAVAAFVGVGGEPDTSVLLTVLRERGVRVLLPILRPDLDLDFREYTGMLVPGALGTSEPPPASPLADLAAVQAVLVPAVAVDRAGRRLGRGGGSYDRALGRLASQVPVIAIIDDSELVDHVPSEPHDRPVTALVTPRRTWRCDAGAGS